MNEKNDIHNQSIPGTLSVGRDIFVGGRMTTRGNSVIERDLYVKGWLNARNIRGAGKGLYETVEKLNAAYPDPHNGWYALVGNSLPADIYRAWGGKWVATGEQGGEPALEFAKVTEIYNELQDEIIAREEADIKLQNAINKETADRKEADSILQKSIETETAERKQADAALQQAIEAEAEERKEADAALQQAIEAEAEERKNADNALSQKIDNIDLSEIEKSIDDLETKHDEDVTELRNAVFPLSLSFTASPLLIEVKQTTDISLRWSARRKNADVSVSTDFTLNGSPAEGLSKTVSVTPESECTLTYTMKAAYEGVSAQQTQTVKAVYRSYFGAVQKDFLPDESGIKGLSGSLNGSRSFTREKINITNGKICFAYPSSFGKLTSIKDGNGYEVISSYTLSDIVVDNVNYYCYLLTKEVSASNVTQIYQ